ncbi:uncharacterized protein LOC142342337 [Convolutriloba macropyga]|uniref:uncharacterized protein LOC142342337 n=1 Tax=Convolutriloba macropyga TaxID=536237 RepID=UPI003F521076
MVANNCDTVSNVPGMKANRSPLHGRDMTLAPELFRIDDCFGQYDAENERARVNVVIPAGPAGKTIGGPRKPVTTTAARPGGMTKQPASTYAPKTTAAAAGPKRSVGTANGAMSQGPAASAARKPAQQPAVPQVQQQMQRTRISGDHESSGADQQMINDLKAQLDEANSQIEGTSAAIEGLERERDFYFSKLRDIEILTQEHEDSGQLPDENVLKRIRDILYATEDGFIAPDDEEDGGVQDENFNDGAENVQDDDETY